MLTKKKTSLVGPIILLVLLIFAVTLPTWASSYITQVALLTFYYVFLSSAWNIIGGFAGQLGFGNSVYIGLGCYVMGICAEQFHISAWIAMILAFVIIGAISLIFGRVTFPLSGTYYSLSSVALLNIVQMAITECDTFLGLEFRAALGIRISWTGVNFWTMQWNTNVPYYFVILCMTIICIFICWMISRNRMGYYFKAIGNNQEAASSLGVRVVLYKQYAQFISSGLCAMGGAFYASYMMFMQPASTFSASQSFNLVVYAIVGGFGTVFGPLLGAGVLYPVNEILRNIFADVLAGLPAVIYGIVLMLTVQFMPNGVLSLIAGMMEKRELKKKIAAQQAAAAAGGAVEEGVKADG